MGLSIVLMYGFTFLTMNWSLCVCNFLVKYLVGVVYANPTCFYLRNWDPWKLKSGIE